MSESHVEHQPSGFCPLKKVTFLKDYRCFKEGDNFEFYPGVNLLVGEQGSGKSTFLELLSKNESLKDFSKVLDIVCDPTSFYFMDFEKNPLRRAGGSGGSLSQNGNVFHAQIATMWKSHGEASNTTLRFLDGEAEDTLVLLDEPDQALSIRSCHKLVNLMNKSVANGCQIIACVHNPTVISAYDYVLSLEHKERMHSSKFIGLHGGD